MPTCPTSGAPCTKECTSPVSVSPPMSRTRPCSSRARNRSSSPASIFSSTAAAASPAVARSDSEHRAVHPRTCVSAISTFRLSLPEDLEFWAAHGIDSVGVSVAKLEAFGWAEGEALVARAVERGLRVHDLIGLAPFHLARPEHWDQRRERLLHAVAAASALGAPAVVFT